MRVWFVKDCVCKKNYFKISDLEKFVRINRIQDFVFKDYRRLLFVMGLAKGMLKKD